MGVRVNLLEGVFMNERKNKGGSFLRVNGESLAQKVKEIIFSVEKEV